MKKILRFSLRVLLIIFVLFNFIAAFHAYKFTHFYNDGEVTIKAAGNITGWDKAKAILFGINYVKSKNLETPQKEYETVYFNTADNIKLEGWYIKTDSAKGTVILFHGHGSSKSKLLDEANYFNSIGYNTLLMDFRAHGGSGGNTCTIGADEAEDVKLAYDFIQSKGEKNIVLWGISLGAATITHAVSKYKLTPRKVILEMPFASLLEAVKGRVRIMGLPTQPIASFLTFWGGVERGFWAFNLKPCEYAKAIQCPVLLQWGAKDVRVTRQEIECIYKNLGTSNKKLIVYETAKHESLCDKEPQKWRSEVKLFLGN
ncbi:MAG TPA: alpha/beta fold hydrolase [Chitinophagaceae bacterium]|nr:alpha/beta fold hydrolase [Chitinophagaceae bacterium]